MNFLNGRVVQELRGYAFAFARRCYDCVEYVPSRIISANYQFSFNEIHGEAMNGLV